MTNERFKPPVADAIRGIRSAFRPGTVMVFDRTREWGGALVKASGEQWVVLQDGRVIRADQPPESERRTISKKTGASIRVRP